MRKSRGTQYPTMVLTSQSCHFAHLFVAFPCFPIRDQGHGFWAAAVTALSLGSEPAAHWQPDSKHTSGEWVTARYLGILPGVPAQCLGSFTRPGKPAAWLLQLNVTNNGRKAGVKTSKLNMRRKLTANTQADSSLSKAHRQTLNPVGMKAPIFFFTQQRLGSPQFVAPCGAADQLCCVPLFPARRSRSELHGQEDLYHSIPSLSQQSSTPTTGDH